MTPVLMRALLAMAVSCIAGPVVLRLLRRASVLDYPSERSSHAIPVPRGGGVAPAVGALVALATTPGLPDRLRWTVFLGVGAFGVLGLIDDVRGIPALPRLGMQLALAVCAGALLLDNLTGSAQWRLTFAVGAVLWLTAFVNAFNFMDGIDGISIAQAVGTGATWLFVGRYSDVPALAYGGAILAGAALGFAPLNLPKARMFLGDAGSYFLGAWLAVFALLGLRAGVPPEAVLAPLTLYVADTGVTLVRRVARGAQWYAPHRDHVYQRLVDRGWSHPTVSALVAGCVLACGGLGALTLSASLLARAVADVAIAGVVGAYLFSPRWLARHAPTMAVA